MLNRREIVYNTQLINQIKVKPHQKFLKVQITKLINMSNRCKMSCWSSNKKMKNK